MVRFAINDGPGETVFRDTRAFGATRDRVLKIVKKGKRYLIQGRLAVRSSINISKIVYRDYPADEKTRTKTAAKTAKAEAGLRATAKRLKVSKASSK